MQQPNNSTQQPAMQPDDMGRAIMLIYGYLVTGEQFWAYIAVRPSMYDSFSRDMSAGQLDMQLLPNYGEIIVSGKGAVPPDAVTMKVAEMFFIDPATLFQQVDMKAELERKMKLLEEQQKSEGAKQ
jgi:hypothetical protein